ncbi:MAG: hypothetical protein H6703_14160 [Myxococcales bacterium]|nr:hypothetical protein [Myxococcales bacterium]MCB9553563.1 hypothetical protein [Myxococcales bacterium]
MYTARCAWLVGDGPALDTLGSALARHHCIVERIAPDAVDGWMSRVRAGDAAVVPNLIILTDAIAFKDGGAPLEVLAARPPWRLLPVVVVTTSDDPTHCRAAYAAGASSWVVVDPADATDEIGEAFARYWLDTALLPEAILPG